MTSRVRIAVIPAAGLGTRFLPATKAQPKEMLTVVDRPAIQWVVEEAVAAGIDDVLIVTSPTKKAVEDHFDRASELEALLEAKGKREMLDQVRRITDLATFHFIRQGAPLGLGHAVSMAERHVGDEPFAVLLPDEIMSDAGATLRRMIDVAADLRSSVVSLREVSGDQISSYGCAGPRSIQGDLVEIEAIVEKPGVDVAPSNLAVAGRYVFQSEIFDRLRRIGPGQGGEIQLADAMAMLIAEPGTVGGGLHGVIIEQAGYDTGQKLEWLRANVELSLDDPVHGEAVAALLAEIVRDRGLA